MNQINWIIQRNLIDDKTLEGLKNAAVKDKASYQEVYIIPFSDDLDIEYNSNFINIFYGTTTLMMNAYKVSEYRKGVFYDYDRFQMKQYLDEWKNRMLNYDGKVLTISELIEEKYNDNDEFFIRPNDDTKAFSGYVTKFAEFKETINCADGQNPYYRMDLLILVCKPKQIEKEWRNIIVNGKVVSSSRYSVYGKKSVDNRDIPDEMIKFAEDCCRIYTPHDVFVMDVALSSGNYYIIECNCFNDSGFYDHDLEEIVKNINDYMRSR